MALLHHVMTADGCAAFQSAGTSDQSTRDLTLEQMRGLDLPVLIVRGAQSNILEADAAVRFAQALPQGKLVTVSDTGHNVHSGNTAGFLDAIAPFLSQLLGE